MKAGVLALIACAALVSAAGCGSSSKSSSTSTTGSGSAGATSGAGSGASSAPVAGSEAFGEPGEKAPSTPEETAPPSGPSARVIYKEVAIAPAKLRVKAGTTIVWTNEDSVEHNVTSVSGPARIESKSLEEGQSFRFVAQRPGTIRYLCTIHPEKMKGTIEVVR